MAAQYGSAVFAFGSGPQTTTLEKDIYTNDTNASPYNWDNGGGASSTSDTSFIMPANGFLVEMNLAAAPATTKAMLMIDNAPSGNIFRLSRHLVTVAIPAKMRIPIRAGAKIQLIAMT